MCFADIYIYTICIYIYMPPPPPLRTYHFVWFRLKRVTRVSYACMHLFLVVYAFGYKFTSSRLQRILHHVCASKAFATYAIASAASWFCQYLSPTCQRVLYLLQTEQQQMYMRHWCTLPTCIFAAEAVV